MDIFINQLKIRLSESNPDNELIERILPGEENGGKFNQKIIDDDGNVSEYSHIEEIVYHLCVGNYSQIKNITETHNISNRNLIEIVNIAFDFVTWKKMSEAAFFVVDHFLLDEKKTTNGVFYYAKELIEKEDYQKVSELIKNYRAKVIPEQITQWATRLFEQAMIFDRADKERDYTKALKIKEIFMLRSSVTEQLALEQYDYNISKENYYAAANLAKVFQLDITRIKRAALMAFKVKFKKFKEAVDKGEYFEKYYKKPDDPYLHAVNILNDFSIMEERGIKDEFSQPYYKEASDFAFFYLRKIMSFPESENFNFLLKSTLSTNLITDYFLSDLVNMKRAEESDRILGEITRKLNELIINLENAEAYHKIVLKLYNIFSSHKSNLKRISYKLFDIFVDNDKIELSYKIYTDFNMDKRDIMEKLMNRCLILLKLRKINEFGKFIETFSVKSDFAKNKDFIERIYFNFDNLVFNGYYEDATALSSMFKFPQNRIAATTVSLCRDLLLKGKDDEVIKIWHKFNLSMKHLRRVFQEIYNIRVKFSWREGYNFRTKFGISIMEIGIIKWLFCEILKFKRISTWYLGEDIEIKKNKSE